MFKQTGQRSFTVIIGLIMILLVSLSVSCSGGSTTTTSASLTTTQPAATSAAAGNPVTIALSASGMAFDTNSIKVPAGSQVTVNFTNKDSVPHNLAVYTDSTASKSIYVGKLISSSSITYTFSAPATPGTYFFRCDTHPGIMKGTFIVE